jgi:hypothetical protein
VGSDAATQPFTVALMHRAFWRAAISILSSLIKFEITRLDVSSDAKTPGTNSSTRPEEGSTILIKSAPLGFKVQVQVQGNKPLSTMCRSSRAEIIDVRPDEKFQLSLVYELQESRKTPEQIHDELFHSHGIEPPSRFFIFYCYAWLIHEGKSMPNSDLLPSLLFKINQNQLALEASIMELANWVERRGSSDVADNVRGALDTISKNEQFINLSLAVLMAPE